MDQLVSLLAEDAVAIGDGGGKAPAVATPVHGAERVARFLVGLGRQVERLGVEIRPADVNGEPGGIALDREGESSASPRSRSPTAASRRSGRS